MLIKKYSNRKLYQQSLGYINLTQLLEIYKQNKDLKVIDVDGENITNKTLLTALFEVELVKGIDSEEINRRLERLK